MKKEEEQMRKFIEETFSSQQKANTANKAQRKGRKGKHGKTELRARAKIPQDEVVRSNIQQLVQYKSKNTLKSSVVQALQQR